MRRFVILAAPRTGSNLLCTLLNSHPDILCHHEIFNPHGIFYAITHRDGQLDLGSMDERDRDPLGFLDRVWKAGDGHACVGFKMTRGQDERVLTTVLASPDVWKVLLRRRNPLRTYVSERIAQRTGCWEAYAESELPPGDVQVRVEWSALRAHMAQTAAFYEALESRLATTGQSYSSLAYEELLLPSRHRAILEALGVAPDVSLTAQSVRQNTRGLAQLIENYTELAALAAGTDLETALSDDGA